MAKNFLFIIDPLESLNVKTDTSLAFMEAAALRAINIFACEIGDIFLIGDKVHFHCARLKQREYSSEKQIRSVDEFFAVFMRKDPPVNELFNTALYSLRCYDNKKTRMINNPDALLCANEKLFGLSFAGKYFPKTIVSQQKDDLLSFIKEQGKVALKPLFGSGGAGVMIMEAHDQNLNAALEILTHDYKKPIMLQRYIKEARKGDKRILILGGKPLGAILRVPRASEHRANFHAGGRAEACEISTHELEMIEDLAPTLLKMGLHFVGIDVLGDYLSEINVTSPTCIREMEAFGQKNLSSQVIDYVESL